MPINLQTGIRAYKSTDCKELFAIASPDIFAWFSYGPFATEKAMRVFYKKLAAECELFTVFNNGTKALHGIFALKNVSDEHQKCEIGHIWYGKKYQKTRVNTEAMFLTLLECFDKRKYRRVAWKCDNLNLNSKRCALRLGFKPEGLFLNDQVIKGKNKDTAWFAIIDKDWQKVKQKLIGLLNRKISL